MPDEAGARIDRLGRRNPAAVRLAMAVSLAARVEPALLRRARLLVNGDVGAESDLWWSELVATQNSSGLVLDPPVAEALRAGLAAPAERELRREAWRLVRDCHAGEADSIRLEELLNWHTVSGEPDAVAHIEELLQAAAQEYLVGASEPTGGVRWILSALRRLPRVAVETPTAVALGAAAAVTLDRSLPDVGDASLPPDVVENWFPWLLSRVFSGTPPAEVPITLGRDALVVGRHGEHAQLLRVPATDPVVLTAIWPEGRGTAHAELRWSEGEEVELPIATDQVDLVAITGERWTVRRRGAPAAPAGLDFSVVRASRRLGVGFAEQRDEVMAAVRDVGGWIVIQGDAWSGKTYLLCAALDQLEDEGAVVVQHFYGRGPAWWDEPDNVVDSLVAQLDAFAPGRPPFRGERPYDRLHQALAFGMPDRTRVVVALDGIPGDSIDDAKSWMFRSPFPSLVPGGARFLVTSRAAMGVRDWLEDGDPFRVVRVEADDAREACEAYTCADGPALALALGQPDRRTVLLDAAGPQLVQSDSDLLVRTMARAGFEIIDPRSFAEGDDWRARTRAAQMVLRVVDAGAADEPDAGRATERDLPVVRLVLRPASDLVPFPDVTVRQDALSRFTIEAAHPLTDEAADDVVEGLQRVAWPFVEEIVSLGQSRVHPVRTLVDWLVARDPGTADLEKLPPTLTGAIDATWSELEREHPSSTLATVLPLLAVAQPGFTLSDLLWLVGADGRERASMVVVALHRLHLLRDTPELDALIDAASSAPLTVLLERHGSTALDAEIGAADVARQLGQPAIDQANATIALSATNPAAPLYVVRHAAVHALRSGESDHAAMLLTSMPYLLRRQRLDGLAALEGDLVELVRVSATPSYSAALLAAVQALTRRTDLAADGFAPALHHELSMRLPVDSWVDVVAMNEVWRPALRFRRRVSAPSAVGDGSVAVAGDVVALTGGITRLALTRQGDVVSWTGSEPLVVASVGAVGEQARIVSAGTNVFVVDGPRAWHLELGAGTVEPLPSPGEGSVVTFLAPTSNGLVTATADGLVRAWWQPGWQAGTFVGHRDAVTAMAEVVDGFVTASEDGTVLRWSWGQAAPRLVFRGHHRPVRAVAALGEAVVSAGDDGTLRWWSTETGHELAVDGASGRPLTACAAMAAGDRVVWGDDSGRLGSWDPATGQRHTWSGHRAAVHDLLTAGTQVVSRAADGSVGVWDIRPGGDATGGPAAFGARDVVKAGGDLIILAGGTITTTSIGALKEPGLRLRLAVDQRADFVAVARGDHVLTNLDIGPASSWDTVTVDWPAVDLGIFHAFGVARRLMWLLGSGRVGTASPGSSAVRVDGGRVLATGESLAVVGSDDGSVTLFELGGGDPVAGDAVAAHRGPVTAVAVGVGRRWASGGRDSTVKVWEQEETVATVPLPRPPDHLALVGEHVVTAALDVVQVWDRVTGELERTLSEGPYVDDLTVVGGLLAVASDDGLIRLWDVGQGRLIDTVPTTRVCALAAGATVLAALDRNGVVTMWENARTEISTTELPVVDLDAGVPASVVVLSEGEDRPWLHAEVAVRFDRDVEIRRVEPEQASGPWRAAINRAAGWWEPVAGSGDLVEPRAFGADIPVHLTFESQDVPELGDSGNPRLSLRLVVSSPLLLDDVVITLSLDGQPDGARASISVAASPEPG